MLPNLLIGGAPKSGTSSLYRWLVAHPSVCGPRQKETFFLIGESSPLRDGPGLADSGWEGYRKLFQHCVGHPIVLEATTHYLYDDQARRAIATMDPAPTMLFLLRKPGRRVLSSFLYSKHTLRRVPQDLDFSEYLRLVRRGSSSFDSLIHDPRTRHVLARDVEFSRYVTFLEEWVQDFPREQILLYPFEDMVADPRAFMMNFCRRLGIDPIFYETYEFTAENTTVRTRIPMLREIRRKATRSRLGSLPPTMKWMRPLLSSEPQPLSQYELAALADLENSFAPFNAALSSRFDVDLRCWERDDASSR